MSRSAIVEELEAEQLKQNVPDFKVGDSVKVHVRIIEGDKERIQVFTGTVIARKGTGLSETFTVHRVAYGEGMERVFLLHSPRIAKIEVLREGRVRRGKLYYLRGTSGKAAKVKGRVVSRSKKKEKKEEEKIAPAVVEETVAEESVAAAEVEAEVQSEETKE